MRLIRNFCRASALTKMNARAVDSEYVGTGAERGDDRLSCCALLCCASDAGALLRVVSWTLQLLVQATLRWKARMDAPTCEEDGADALVLDTRLAPASLCVHISDPLVSSPHLKHPCGRGRSAIDDA